MKKWCFVLVFLVVALATINIAGCSPMNVSSREEAEFETSRLPDYIRLISLTTFKIRYADIGFCFIQIIGNGNNALASGDVFHVAVYQTKDGGAKTIIWDGSRPPKSVKVN